MSAFDHLMSLSDEEWDDLVEEFALLEANSVPGLQRMFNDLGVAAGLKQIRSRRHSRAIRLERES